MSKEIVHGGLSQAEIYALKKEHKCDIRCITVNAPSGLDYYWFKEPNIQIMSAVGRVTSDDGQIEGNKIFFTNCLIKGNANIFNEDIHVWANLNGKLQSLIETYETSIKKF